MKFGITGRRGAILGAATALALALSSCGGGANVDFLYVVTAGQTTTGSSVDGTVFSYGVDGDSGYIDLVGDQSYPTGGVNAVASVSTSDAKWVYILNHDDDTLVEFGDRVGEGTITPLNTYNTIGTQPTAMAIDSSNKYIFVTDNAGCFLAPGQSTPKCYSTTNPGPGDLAVFTIDDSTGELAPLKLNCDPTVDQSFLYSVPTGTGPQGVTATPNANFVFVANSGVPPTGSTAPTKPGTISIYTPDTYNAGGCTANGAYVPAPGNGGTYTIGSQGEPGSGFEPWAVYATASNLYVTDYANEQVLAYSIGTDGALAYIGSGPTSPAPDAVLADSAGKNLYVANYVGNTITVFQINGDGTLSLASSIGAGTGPKALTFAPTGGYLYAANYLDNSVSGYVVNSDGSLTLALRFPIAIKGTHPSALTAVKRNP